MIQAKKHLKRELLKPVCAQEILANIIWYLPQVGFPEKQPQRWSSLHSVFEIDTCERERKGAGVGREESPVKTQSPERLRLALQGALELERPFTLLAQLGLDVQVPSPSISD